MSLQLRETSQDKLKLNRNIVYIASPWFNESQSERLEKVYNLVLSFGFSPWSAKYDGIVVPFNASREVRRKAFKENLEVINKSRFIVVITDEKDVGTLWEMGYAYSIHKPIIGYAETLGDKPFNLMLAESCNSVAKSLNELSDILTYYVERGVFPVIGVDNVE